MNRSPVYKLQKVGKIWQCQVDGEKNVCGAGGRPDLAIRDWKEQKRRRDKANRKFRAEQEMLESYYPKRPDDPKDEYPQKGVHY